MNFEESSFNSSKDWSFHELMMRRGVKKKNSRPLNVVGRSDPRRDVSLSRPDAENLDLEEAFTTSDGSDNEEASTEFDDDGFPDEEEASRVQSDQRTRFCCHQLPSRRANGFNDAKDDCLHPGRRRG
jgi:hypothetical protein